MNCGGLCTILKSILGRESPVASERICLIAMRASDANDRFVIPIDHVIQQTHCAGMRYEGTDLRLINERVHSGKLRLGSDKTLRTHNQRARCPLAPQPRWLCYRCRLNPKTDKS